MNQILDRPHTCGRRRQGAGERGPGEGLRPPEETAGLGRWQVGRLLLVSYSNSVTQLLVYISSFSYSHSLLFYVAVIIYVYSIL